MAVRKRGRKSKKVSESESKAEPVSAEELKRRDEQKKVQELVLKLKSEGCDDQEIKKQKYRLKSNLRWSIQDRREYWKQKKHENAKTKKVIGSGNHSDKLKEANKSNDGDVDEEEPEENEAPLDETSDQEDDRLEKEAKVGNHEVIVVPIVWRGRHDRQLLLNVANDVKKVLTQQKVDCWIDSRRQHTPGQKFAFWEHKGAKFRIEVGPKDYERGMVCVCKHPEVPGDYKNTIKKYVPIPPGGARDLLIELKKFGLEKLNVVLPLNEDRDLTVMEKIDYSSLYKKDEVGGTIADYSQRFGQHDGANAKYGGGGRVKPEGVDGSKEAYSKIELPSGDGMEENYVLSEKPFKQPKKSKADYGKSGKSKVKKSFG